VTLPRTFLVLPLLAVSAIAASSSAETLESVQRKLQEKVAGYKTIQFRSQMRAETSQGGVMVTSWLQQVTEFLKEGDKVLSRIESKSERVEKAGDQSAKMESSLLEISDGQHDYALLEAQGAIRATKRTANTTNRFTPFDPMRGFKMMEENIEMRLLPDETIDGQETFVIEMKPRSGSANLPAGRSLVYYDKATGINVRSITYDMRGKLTTTTVNTDIKIDAPIARDRFAFKPPPGVEVTDLTNVPTSAPAR